MLELKNAKYAKYGYDSKIGFIGFEIVGNDEMISSVLKVKRTVLGTEKNDFPNYSSYYLYSNYSRYHQPKPRTEIVLMSENEWNQLATSLELCKKRTVLLYGVTMFSSDTIYTYASFNELQENSFVKVPLRNSEQKTSVRIIEFQGFSDVENCIKNNIVII